MRYRSLKSDGFTLFESILVLAVLIAIGLMGWYVLSKHRTPAPVSNLASTSSTVPKTDTWVGQGKTQNWSEAANWSRGVPQNGDNIVIDVASVKGAKDQGVNLNNDISGRTYGTITFTGEAFDVGVKGKAMSLSGGIIDDTINEAANDSSQAVTQVSIATDLSLTKDAIIRTNDSGSILSIGDNGSLALAGHALRITNQGKSTVSIWSKLSGTGSVAINDAGGGVYLYTASPEFKGRVNLERGFVDSGPNSFGSGNVTVAAGTNWDISAAGTNSATIANSISVAGQGIARDHTVSGAISACLTQGEEGCSTSGTLHFTAPITLTADAQIGTSSTSGSDSYHVDYIFGQINRNGHKLTVVNDYRMTLEL